MSLHPLTIRKRVPWGFLVWTVPLLYVFWAPYQHRAGWVEWTATTLTLVAVLASFLAALTYPEQRKIVTAICVAMLLIAIGFLAYRPSGGIYFPVAATFAPQAVRGRFGSSLAILCAIAALFGVEWSLLYLDGSQGVFFPLLIAAYIFFSGIGATVIARQASDVQRRDKASERERIAKDPNSLSRRSRTTSRRLRVSGRRSRHRQSSTSPERSSTSDDGCCCAHKWSSITHGRFVTRGRRVVDRAQSVVALASLLLRATTPRRDRRRVAPAESRAYLLLAVTPEV